MKMTRAVPLAAAVTSLGILVGCSSAPAEPDVTVTKTATVASDETATETATATKTKAATATKTKTVTAGTGSNAKSGDESEPTSTAGSDTSGASAQLEALPVKGRAPKTGYDRDLFGSAWSDDVNEEFGHNGCDTRIICTPRS